MKTVVLLPQNKLITKTSSKGSQAKWLLSGCWYKQDLVGFESAGEVLSSRVAHLLNINMPVIDYNPCFIELPTGTFLGCESKSFLAEGDTETTAQRILEADLGYHLARVVSPMEQLHLLLNRHAWLADQLACLLQFDRIIKNHDRHLHNIVIRNLSEIILFDNGDSCTSDITYDYPINATQQEILNVTFSKPLMKSFDASCEAIGRFSSFRLEAKSRELMVSDLYGVYPDWFLRRATWLLKHQFMEYLETDLQII